MVLEGYVLAENSGRELSCVVVGELIGGALSSWCVPLGPKNDKFLCGCGVYFSTDSFTDMFVKLTDATNG